MPRSKLLVSDYLPYHVTGRTNNRERFPIPLSQMWEILTYQCRDAMLFHEVEIQALALMSNHFHMKLTSPVHALGVVMERFMKSVSKTVNGISGRSGHLWGGPHFWSLIDGGLYYVNVLKYIYRNPVRAGLVEYVQDYPYSTVHGLIGTGQAPFPLYYSRAAMGFSLPQESDERFLRWLNNATPAEQEEAIRRGLKKKRFEIAPHPSTRREIRLTAPV